MRRWIRALIPALSLLTACDEARTPCVEADGSSVVLWADCPEHPTVELSSLVVYDRDTAVWSIANTSRDNEIDRIVYGDAPADWTTLLEPEALESGRSYTGVFTYYDAPSQSALFTAP